MAGTIRERQKEVVRDAILSALADHVAERGLFEFSVPEVAERAGVSHRTVYNYFPNRQALLDALSEWATKRMADLGGGDDMRSLDTIVALTEPNFDVFSRMGGLSQALARIDASAAAQPEPHHRRTARIREVVDRELAGLPVADRHAFAGVLRTLLSIRTWYSMVEEQGLPVADAGRTVGWAAQVLVDAAREAAAAGDAFVAPRPAEGDGHGGE